MANTIAKEGFEMFLGTKADLEELKAESHKDISFNLVINDNPLTDFVEIPEHLSGLSYNNIICGAIRGAIGSVRDNLEYNKLNIARLTNKGNNNYSFLFWLKTSCC